MISSSFRLSLLSLGIYMCMSVQGCKDSEAQIKFAALHKTIEVKHGQKVKVIYPFENTGNSELIIKSVHADCGCINVEFSKEAIPPGESGQVSLVYDSNSAGPGVNSRMVLIESNIKGLFSTLNLLSIVNK